MKVYESSHQNKRDYKKVPQIKIKNSMLSQVGFKAGKEYAIIYQPSKITLILVERDKSIK
jgi:hypothetical protein